MQTFPAALPLEGKTVVVTGAGPMAEAKLRLFLTSPAQLRWLRGRQESTSPSALENRAQTLDRAPEARDFEGAALVFIAEADPTARRQQARWARNAGALVNLVDEPAGSDFQTPALVDRDEVVVAIATGGAAPVLSVDLRAAIERLLPPRIGRLAALAREMRSTVKRVLGDFEARRAFWERVLRGPARDLALAGDQEGARRAFLDTLNRPEAPREGVVHLVGAGPGDPELLTLRAARLLREADVIVHDRLVSPEVLDLARRDARRIDVGKQRNHHPVPQEAIEALLVEEAQKGQRVVRLKGGDPFIFGRGGEEITALRAAGLRVEVTPGISAALAAAASSQIPLTHRGLASSLTLASGVGRRGGPAPDLRALVEGTGALYMSVDAAPRIQAQLLALGRTGATPVALVEHASRDQERTVYCTLATLASTVVSEAVTGPAIIFLGDAVTLGAAYERAPEPAPQQEAQRA